MSAVAPNRMLPPVHSYGAGPNPGPRELMQASQAAKAPRVEIPGARPLEIGGAFPGPAGLLRGTHVEPRREVEVPGVRLLSVGGSFPGPESLIEATRVRKLQSVQIPGARPLGVAGAYPGPADLIHGTDPVKPHAVEVPGVQMGYKPPDSYLSLKAYLDNLHISLAAAPPGRESAPPSARQAAIDAYTGR